MRPSRLAPAALTALLAGCSQAPPADPRMVSEWMHTVYGVVRSERLGPSVASRVYAYAGLALHEGMAAADPRMTSLAPGLNTAPALPRAEPGVRYDPAITAMAAEQTILDTLFREALPATRATLAGLADSLMRAGEARGTGAEVSQRSRALGAAVGNAIAAWSRADGFAETRGKPWTAPVGEAFWINDTPPNLYAAQNLSGATDFVALDNPANLMKNPGAASDRGMVMNRPKRPGLRELPPINMAGVTEPYWGTLRPFFLTAWNECPVPPPPAYGTTPEAALYRNARAVYDTKQGLTPEQKAIALYWADNPGESGTPAGHWTAIASQMIGEKHLDARRAARLFAVSAAAQADAFIASWGYKFQYNLIRPRSFIRRVIDPSWEPQIPTPPFPEHPAGHSTQSAAAAAVLAGLLGDGPFSDSTALAIGHPVRRFGSFPEAAREAGQSRVYGGIHYPSGNEGGRSLGACIGARALERAPGAGTAQ